MRSPILDDRGGDSRTRSQILDRWHGTSGLRVCDLLHTLAVWRMWRDVPTSFKWILSEIAFRAEALSLERFGNDGENPFSNGRQKPFRADCRQIFMFFLTHKIYPDFEKNVKGVIEKI